MATLQNSPTAKREMCQMGVKKYSMPASVYVCANTCTRFADRREKKKRIGAKWCEMVRNGTKWCEMVRNAR
ncbi:hypothetical protein POVWA1_039150 [Plasmodium ovale wallikeri]|uniref:Uncharacterized protein n=1 Tax=Plasmodium ovale wallikeri TaxID=864142 RepID=A0A1A8Z4U3_PLAOA|nr:hypothetical protein POVWA1_039150 [Plasmodium ovale wallikeri]